MSEPIPLAQHCSLCITHDFAIFTQLPNKNVRVYLTTPRYFVEVTHIIDVDRVRRLCADPRFFSIVCDIDDYIRIIARELRSLIEGRNLIFNFSGGKDSCAALILLMKLQEYLSFNLKVVYVHIPYLDDQRILSFVDYIRSRFGIDIEVLEHRRRDVRSYLKWRGLPRIGERWCTKFKVIPSKKLARKLDAYEVLATRASESPKRSRLYGSLNTVILKRSRKLYIMPLLTLIDVLKIVRRYSILNPLYTEGHLRISCALCPYKSLYELSLGYEIEDEGLIDSVLRREHAKHYRGIDYEQFIEYALWRYRPANARRVLALMKHVERLAESHRISVDDMRKLISEFWVSTDLDLFPCTRSIREQRIEGHSL